MNGKKIALITGVTGQDGSYLAELLLSKGYEVHAIKRRSSSFNTERIDHIFEPTQKDNPSFRLYYSDMTDTQSLINIMASIKPHEIYNLAAQSHVGVSFEIPEYTTNVNALGTLRILEAIRILDLTNQTRFYQASTSELFGNPDEFPQTEETPFRPNSPYAISKLYAYWITKNYREAFGIFACNGILFNHESPRRGETFVTRKITRGLVNIAQGIEDCLYMGNIDAKRDWGDAREFVQMQWLMLQQDAPSDFAIATGKQYSIRDFIRWTAQELGIEMEFHGKGTEEIAMVSSISGNLAPALNIGDTIIRIDPRYYRPVDVPSLLGNPAKAERELGWKPVKSAREICAEMVSKDLLDVCQKKGASFTNSKV
ncbi:MAG: GDP-mannose 4,6-dehydratase [Verrucomicrobiaceae bacterium]|nr:GDP-mannose 4,6-dehydratase [Verrucomicrobiaceae bacterium]